MQRRLFNQCLLAIGLFVIPALVMADSSTRSNMPEFPVFGIMDHFFFTGTYAAHLNITELRIDHMAANTECSMPHRACRLSLGYSMPIGRNLGMSQYELPLFGSTGITSPWSTASFGDYVARFWDASGNIPVPAAALKLILTLKF